MLRTIFEPHNSAMLQAQQAWDNVLQSNQQATTQLAQILERVELTNQKIIPQFQFETVANMSHQFSALVSVVENITRINFNPVQIFIEDLLSVKLEDYINAYSEIMLAAKWFPYFSTKCY